ncbi:MAG: hypothetical protein ACR2QM_00980 [Longimicrobiales bacterium]
MREYGSGERGEGVAPAAGADADSRGGLRDGLIFDVSEMGQMNVGDLAILLTASRLAREENVDVWVTGLPGQSWKVLHALGLGDEFKQFPDEEDENNA